MTPREEHRTAEGRGNDQEQDRWQEERPEEPPARSGRDPGGRPPGERPRALAYAAVAITVAAAAALVVLLLKGGLTGSQPSAAPQANPPATAPGGGGGGGGQFSGGGGGGGTMMMGGTVSAVSATSLTLGAGSHTITASITGATQFSGVHNAAGIKPGDRVTARITGYGGGHPVVSAIQDPAQVP